MKQIIEWIESGHRNYSRKFIVSMEGMKLLSTLSARESQLFMDILERVKNGMTEHDIIVRADHKDLGYNTPQQLHRDRKVLIGKGLIAYNRNQYLINPFLVKYSGPKQWRWLLAHYGLTEDWRPKGFR